jgi:hypothetical protein
LVRSGGNKMASNSCTRCAALEAENTRLRQEIKRLRWKLRQIARYIEAALSAVKGVETYLLNVLYAARKILSQRSGVKRHIWLYYRARFEVARRALGGVTSTVKVLERAKDLAIAKNNF